MKRNNPAILIFAVLVAGTLSLYLADLKPNTFGFYHDDGIYVVTAKALATGNGYRIISLPSEPAQTKYPPFYPFLLSLIWRLHPQFPENLSAMMLLSALATIGFLALTWWYLTTQKYASKGLALLVVGLVAINWRTLILATGIYSEMFYALLSIAGLYFAEAHDKDKQTWKGSVGLGLVIGLAFLTRTSGIALLISLGAYYALHKRFRRVLVPLAAGGVFVIAWVGWSYINRTSGDGVNTAYYTSYFRDFSDIITELQREGNASLLSILLKLILRNVALITFTIPTVCLGLSVNSIQALSGHFIVLGLGLLVVAVLLVIKGFVRTSPGGLRLLHTYVLTYLALHLLWPYGIYDRFLMPLLPFLLLFLTTEIAGLIQLARREFSSSGQIAGRLAAIVLVSAMFMVLGVTLYNYGAGAYRSLFSSKDNADNRAAEDAQAIGWINTNTPASDVLVCYRDPLYYLYTGRKATRLSSKDESRLDGPRATDDRRAHSIFRILDESHPRYLISTSSDFALEGQAELRRQGLSTSLEKNPNVFVPVFESEDGRCVIYRIQNDER
ncbi:MAG: glycosyltransferase family 39 protein [Blastocatellia bacterium]